MASKDTDTHAHTNKKHVRNLRSFLLFLQPKLGGRAGETAARALSVFEISQPS